MGEQDYPPGLPSSNTEGVEDIVGSLIVGKNDVSVVYDDEKGQLEVDASTLSDEEVEDIVGSLIQSGDALTVAYDDPGNTLTVSVDESGLSFYDGSNLTATVNNQQVNTDEADVESVLSIPELSSDPATGNLWIRSDL